MPLYEYRCAKCAKVFEVLQKFSDEPLKKHPQCGGKVERLISASGLQFKGTGWYITDYARSGSKSEGSKSESSPAASETKTESKTETKSESKSSDSSSSESKPTKSSKSSKKGD